MIKNIDCRDGLKALEDNSIDAIITDPPYEIGFMSKKWDKTGIAYDVDMWRECLRVLKPGGYLLSFSSSRTYHRMTVAIEDAGFEIRDQIMWIYSTGFPKSHNINKHYKDMICGCMVSYTNEKTTKEKTECDMHTLRNTNVSSTLDIAEGGREVLQQGLQEQGIPIEKREEFPASEIWGNESRMEGRGDCFQKEGELQEYKIHKGSTEFNTNGQEGRLHNGTQNDNVGMVQYVINKERSSPSHRSQPIKQRKKQPGIMAGQQEPQISGTWKVCGRCNKQILPNGLGTALKPAHEPICVARKPSIGTVAQNVLAHGTGALNIDACRVGDDVMPQVVAGQAKIGTFDRGVMVTPERVGRYPANLIHDGIDETWGKYFYCAKASKKDRGEDNNHPTVKPTELMRYLCRLVTPKDGLILDPFAGSGSTGKAAILEGFKFIGFEKEPQYSLFANSRIPSLCT